MATTRPVKNYTRLAIAIVIAALVIGASIFASSYFARTSSTCEYGTVDVSGTITCAFPGSSTPTQTQSSSVATSITETQPTSSSQTTTSTTQSTEGCVTAPGQPQGAFFRVLYDSNSSPVAGASVVAIPTASYGCSVSQETFTTNATQWYSLDYLNTATILIVVTYQGSQYNMTMRLGLSIWNCGTLYIPSGATNEAVSPETTCASTSTSTSSSSTSTSTAATHSTTTITPNGTSCSGYPPAADCPGLVSYNYTISVAYVGSWNLTYFVYDNGGTPLGSLASGSYTGTGDSTTSVSVVWDNLQFLTLCATATKLDGSDATLTVGITGTNSTSAPYGSVTYCSGAGD